MIRSHIGEREDRFFATVFLGYAVVVVSVELLRFGRAENRPAACA